MNRIKELRNEKNLTLQELSDKTKIGRNSINQYENGTRYPKLETWQKLADFFKVSVPYIQGKSNIRTNDVDHLFKLAQIDNRNVVMAVPSINDNLDEILNTNKIKVFNSEGKDITNVLSKQKPNNKKFVDLPKYKALLEKVALKSSKGDKIARNILLSIINLLDIYD